MKSIFILFVIIFTTSCGYSQNENEIVIQIALNNAKLLQHIQKQKMIRIEEIDAIRDNGLIDTNFNLKFNGIRLSFNNGNSKSLFDYHWDFEIIALSITDKKAIVNYNFIPSWKSCNKHESYIAQNDALYMDIMVILEKANNEWKVVSSQLNDIVFESDDPKIKCIQEKYIPMH